MNKKKRLIILPLVFAILLSSSIAFMPQPAEFKGKIVVDGNLAPVGTVVEAYDLNNILCGRTIVKQKGVYGLMSCNGDDLLSIIDEGADSHELIIFFINQKKAFSVGDNLWEEGKILNADLILGDVNKASGYIKLAPVKEFPKNYAIYGLIPIILIMFFIVFLILKKKKILFLVFMFIFLHNVLYSVEAFPPIACEFYGNVTINRSQAPVGTSVSAYDINNVLCGNFSVVNEGYYGLLSCNGDSPETSQDEGAQSLENITFFINGNPTRKFFNFSWASGEFHFVYLDRNYAPIIYLTRNLISIEDVLFYYDVNASDQNDDILFFYDNSTFFNINIASGIISFTPTNDDVGYYQINISVFDEFGLSDYRIINFTVINVNDAPFFNPRLENITVYAEKTVYYDINATDIDKGDVLKFFTNSTLFNISKTTGLINFTTKRNQAGNYSINVSVCDNSGAYNNCTNGIFILYILFSNHPPVLSRIGNHLLYANFPFFIDVNATDEDNDTLTFWENSTLFVINPITGIVSFTPTINDVGRHDIRFWVGDNYTNVSEIVSFVIYPALFCGDGVCSDLISETCFTCPQDCGVCPEGTSDLAGSAGGAAGMVGGAGAQGQAQDQAQAGAAGQTGQAGAGGSQAQAQGGAGAIGMPNPSMFVNCTQNWTCTDWGPCVEGIQKRTCSDSNNCSEELDYQAKRGVVIKIIEMSKPPEEQPCSLEPNCFDGLQNCHDGGCEEGIDCGGSCEKCGISQIPKYAKLPFTEMPGQPGCGNGVCSDGEECACMRDCRQFPWKLLIIFMAILFSIFLIIKFYYFIEFKLNKIKKGIYLKKTMRANLFLLFGIIIIIIIILYIYFYSSCSYIFKILSWIPIFLIIILPSIIYIVLAKFGYLESRNKRKLEKLLKNHQEQIRNFINVEEKLILDVEEKCSKGLLELMNNNSEIAIDIPDIKEIGGLFENLRILRQKKENTDDVEINLCKTIIAFTKNEHFKKHIDVIKPIYDELKSIFHFYRQKEKLQEKIMDIEKELLME